MPSNERLALGTVQFGQPYGITDRDGRVSLNQATQILDIARAAGLDTLDTAVGYGDSEARLGELGVAGWRIVSKLPEFREAVGDIPRWVESSVASLLQRLGIDHLHGLLLHRPLELKENHGPALLGALLAVRDEGLTDRIGLSVYEPAELDEVWVPELDLIQAPFNVFDRRIVTSGWLARLNDAGVEVHARSVFLQGLLLMEKPPSYFDPWSGALSEWSRWCETESLSPLQASLGFVMAQLGIERVIVGVDTPEHLEEILAIGDIRMASPPDTLMSDDLDLINPSRWNLP